MRRRLTRSDLWCAVAAIGLGVAVVQYQDAVLYFAIAFVAALVVRFVWSRISRQPSKPSTGRLQKYPVTVLLFVQYLPLVILPAYLFATLRTMRRTTWIRTQQTPVRRIAGPRVSI